MQADALPLSVIPPTANTTTAARAPRITMTMRSSVWARARCRHCAQLHRLKAPAANDETPLQTIPRTGRLLLAKRASMDYAIAAAGTVITVLLAVFFIRNH